jgi:hypothetical protein
MTGQFILRLRKILAGAAFLALAGPIAGALAAPPDNSGNPALPQNNVAGTDAMLHNSIRAERAAIAVANARNAIGRCDKDGFAVARNQLQDVINGASHRAGGATAYIVHDAGGEDEAALRGLKTTLWDEWQAACAKPKPKKEEASVFGGAGVHAGRINLPALRYLGFEAALTLVQTLGVVAGENEGSVAGASIGGEGFLPVWNMWWAANLSRSSTNVASDIATIDPMGDGLLIPGPLGGASGFALPSAGGLNVVNNAEFRGQYDWLDFHAKFGMPYECEELLFLPFFGVGLTRGDTDARFSGSIPGYGRDFEYNTGIRVDTVSLLFGTNLVHEFKGGNLHAGGLASLDFNDASGTDRLTFTGFADSRASLDNDDTTVGGRVWAGATFGDKGSPFKLSLDFAWIHSANVPVVTRDGTNPSRLDLESADAFVGALSAKVSF